LNKKLSDKDKKDWQKFIESNEKIENKDANNQKLKKTFTEKTIDLHGYTLEKANKKIKNFIEECYSNGVSKINIITGKGSRSKNKNDPYISSDLSILKYSIPEYIKRDTDLMKIIKKIDFVSIESQNSGSFKIILKKNNTINK